MEFEADRDRSGYDNPYKDMHDLGFKYGNGIALEHYHNLNLDPRYTVGKTSEATLPSISPSPQQPRVSVGAAFAVKSNQHLEQDSTSFSTLLGTIPLTQPNKPFTSNSQNEPTVQPHSHLLQTSIKEDDAAKRKLKDHCRGIVLARLNKYYGEKKFASKVDIVVNQK